VATALQLFAAEIQLWIIPHTYRGFVHPQLIMCFTKLFEMLSDLSRILYSLWLLKFLSACIMVNSKCLALFIDILCTIILRPLIQYDAVVRNCQSQLESILPAQTSFLNMSWFSTNQLPSVVPLSLFSLSIRNQSVCIRSFDLES